MRNAFTLEEHFEDIRGAYEDDLTPIIEIASWFHVSRQAIYKVLRKHGIDTSKRRFPVKCYVCGDTILRPKCQIRKTKHPFCSDECYYAWLETGGRHGGEYNPSRQGQRIGRMKVSKYFDLEPGMVVHHENRTCLDNRLSNLRVFKNQSDHLKYHRDCGDIKPVWDGSLI